MTQAPAEEIRFIHDRIPVLFYKERAGAWLDLQTPLESLLLEPVRDALFQPVEATESKSVPII